MYSNFTITLFLLVLLACQNPKPHKNITPTISDSIIPSHQKYAQARIREADFWDRGFSASDSFYLWSWDDFGKNFQMNRITRTLCEEGYAYSFWTTKTDTLVVYNEETVPLVQLVSDTMFDVNGDTLKDLVIVFNTNNGKCCPDQTLLFLLDDSSKKFLPFSQVSEIPNARFFPKRKRIVSEVVCDCIRIYSEFEWTGSLKLEKRKETSKNVCKEEAF